MRKSSEEGLEQEFNSLDAQRGACETCIRGQRSEGWTLNAVQYDDGGFWGGDMGRPGLARFIEDIKVVSVAVPAKRERLCRCRRYVARIVRLAPDSMQAIVYDKVPPALSLDRLKKGFPLDWQAQRASLGFSG